MSVVNVKVIENIVYVCVLMYMALEDLRYKSVRMAVLIISSLVVVISVSVNLLWIDVVQTDNIMLELGGLIITIIVLLTGSIKYGWLGLADVIIIAQICLLIGIEKGLAILFLSVVGALLFGMIYILKNNISKKRKISLPLIPFITFAFMGVLLCV